MTTTDTTYLTEYQERAIATRNRRAHLYAQEREAKKAMQLYFADNAIARKTRCNYPKMDDFVTRINGQLIATDYARSRFNELKKGKA